MLKALGTGFSGMRFTDVEVIRESSGRPVPRLSGKAAERAAELGVVEMHLSLSFTHSTAVASAVAITEDSRPRKDGRKTAARLSCVDCTPRPGPRSSTPIP